MISSTSFGQPFRLDIPQRWCDRVSPIVSEAPAGQELFSRSHVTMGTLSRRGRHFEVASTTSDDEDTADWPAGGQKPGIPQEDGRAASEDGRAASEDGRAASEDGRAASEDGRAAKEDGGAASEEKGGGGGGGGRRGQPHKPEDNPEDGGQTHWPGTWETTPEWYRSPRGPDQKTAGPETTERTSTEPATAPEGRGSGRDQPARPSLRGAWPCARVAVSWQPGVRVSSLAHGHVVSAGLGRERWNRLTV
ncbi:hypothetical protein NDU88_005838 [Pleurodeles waltl]|uniref:Uncharacterized protein n=1 Tax=Pleurodeles waltl TaxID=8319 RepID=A0AAV7RN78_PLEWA|nr:hypothetical protein NDU88_005838 [Pleurodeles waltl]